MRTKPKAVMPGNEARVLNALLIYYAESVTKISYNFVATLGTASTMQQHHVDNFNNTSSVGNINKC